MAHQSNSVTTAQVAGAETQNDPNHPVENYFGNAEYRDLDLMEYNLGLKVYPEDKVDTVPPPEMGIGSKITITRATPIEITDAKTLNIYRTWQTTVSQLLTEKKIVLLGQDSANPGLNQKLSYNLKVKITRVAEVEVVETQPIDYKVIKKTSVDLEKGQTSIETKGIDGVKSVTYTIKRIDGVEVSRIVKDTQITKQSQTQIVIIGIGPRLAKSGPYKDTINAAAKDYLINGTALMCLMMAESNGHNDSVNPDGYFGLFQYSDSFWADASSRAGYGGADWSSAKAQIYTTAWALTYGYGGRWGGTWPYCSGK